MGIKRSAWLNQPRPATISMIRTDGRPGSGASATSTSGAGRPACKHASAKASWMLASLVSART